MSETFYRLHQEGMLEDEDPAEIQIYLEWAAQYDIFIDRRQRYNNAIQQRLLQLPSPASLGDLQVNQLSVAI